MTSFYGSTCANNGKGALNTSENTNIWVYEYECRDRVVKRLIKGLTDSSRPWRFLRFLLGVRERSGRELNSEHSPMGEASAEQGEARRAA
eukprot:787358-Pyramimonas_sp.AAC.1